MENSGAQAAGGGPYDYLVVGGGIAGLYTAWRLKDHPDRPNVALIEYDGRLGGRLLTVTPPRISNARVELGAMRYIPATQPKVTQLIEHLGLVAEPHVPTQSKNVAYLRGKHLTTADVQRCENLPYELTGVPKDATLESSAFKVLAPAARQVLGLPIKTLHDLLELTPAQKEQVSRHGRYPARPNGRLLRDVPLRYALMRTLEAEAVRLLDDSTGYDTLLHTWSAADGYWWHLADFGSDIEYFHLQGGMDQLTQRIASKLKDANVQVRTSTRLLRYEVVDGVVWADICEDGKEVETYRARNLILALPRQSLKLIDGFADTCQLLDAVRSVPLFKLAITYSKPWWQHARKGAPIVAGKSTTDLPIRQCWYWDSDPETGESVVMVYDDGTDLDYWVDLRDKDRPKASHPTKAQWDDFPAPPEMIAEAHRQLVEMHDMRGQKVPLPRRAAYRNWGEDPIGAGAHFWKVGYDSYDVAAKMLRPTQDPVWVCGEAYSHAQGWVEGALDTAEQVLAQLGCRPPAWSEP